MVFHLEVSLNEITYITMPVSKLTVPKFPIYLQYTTVAFMLSTTSYTEVNKGISGEDGYRG